MTTDKKKAEHLNKHFATVTKSNKKSDFDRTLKQDLRKEELSNERSTPEIFMTNITAGELEKILHALKSRKSHGPDKLHAEKN